MNLADLEHNPHRRYNPLLQEWVLVSPQRTGRPWRGKVDESKPMTRLGYDASCYLCPGNERANGARNPNYTSTFVFENDYAALLPATSGRTMEEEALLVASPEAGVSRVVCFTPRHDLAIPLMSLAEILQVVNVWVEQYQELAKTGWIRHVQIFENRGVLMGTSNPHPHCQIWANATVPNIPTRELKSFEEFQATKGNCLLCRYLELERERGERIVFENESFVVLVPYWAVWPFETLVLSKRHVGAMEELSAGERSALADGLKNLTTRYDNLFETSFPYSMGFHQRPTDGKPHPEWHFHAHYYPPLLRSASIQKFMVGYELLAAPQRDITAETAAARLRGVSETHYATTG